MTLDTLRSRLLTLGIPGLFLIAFLDSAGVPIPGGVDLVVMLLAWQRPGDAVLVAVTATPGSVLGSLVLYRIARTQGSAVLSRVREEKQDRIKEKFRRNDILAMVVAMLGSPPPPTKLFVLVAGVVRMDWRRFTAVAFAGRLIRFLGQPCRLTEWPFAAYEFCTPIRGFRGFYIPPSPPITHPPSRRQPLIT